MNKQITGFVLLFALLNLIACSAPYVLEKEPLKTVEQTRKEAHRTTPNTNPVDDVEEEDSDKNEEEGTGQVAIKMPETPTVPAVEKKLISKEKADEFTEKAVTATGEAPTYLQSDEFEMIREVNLMRADPQGYISYVKTYIEQVQSDERLDAAYRADEVSTARELIAELKNLDKLSVLQPHEGLYKVGIKHGKDIQQQGMIGHRGKDGTMPWDRVRNNTDLSDGNENLVGGGESVREQVMILLVDSGIPGRGHRKTLLEPKWTHLACHKIGEVGGIPNNWIQVFGNE